MEESLKEAKISSYMLSLFLTYALSAAERLKKGERNKTQRLLSFKINAARK